MGDEMNIPGVARGVPILNPAVVGDRVVTVKTETYIAKNDEARQALLQAGFVEDKTTEYDVATGGFKTVDVFIPRGDYERYASITGQGKRQAEQFVAQQRRFTPTAPQAQAGLKPVVAAPKAPKTNQK